MRAALPSSHSPHILFPALMLLLLLLQPTELRADSVSRALNRADYARTDREAIEAVFDKAEAANVPSELLLPRLQQGIAKSIPAARVRRALDEDLRQLLHARELVQSTEAGAAIVEETAAWARAANLLDSGRTEEELRNLATVSSERPEAFRPASTLYVSIVDWGLDEPTALALVEAAVDSALPASEFAGITELLVRGRRARIRPEQLVQRLIANLPHAQSLAELRDMTLE